MVTGHPSAVTGGVTEPLLHENRTFVGGHQPPASVAMVEAWTGTYPQSHITNQATLSSCWSCLRECGGLCGLDELAHPLASLPL